MSNSANEAAEHAEHGEHHDHTAHYVKIWGVLLVLLVISILGPEIGVRWITMLTAFGIAFVKAGLVIKYFMHLGDEKPWLQWLMVTSLALMAIMFAGISPDVMKHEGHNWDNYSAQAAVERGLPDPDHGDDHADDGDHGDDAKHGKDEHGGDGAH